MAGGGFLGPIRRFWRWYEPLLRGDAPTHYPIEWNETPDAFDHLIDLPDITPEPEAASPSDGSGTAHELRENRER